MKYNLPTLLALCQDTGVSCQWTSQSQHCRLTRPDRDEKPILSEHPRNRSSRQPVRPSRSSKNQKSKPKSQRRAKPVEKTSGFSFAANDAGFARFLKQHTSPKHQRVTAGGRIVPMQQPKELHNKETSPAAIVRVNRTEPLVGHIVIDSRAITMNGENNTMNDENNGTENVRPTNPNSHAGNPNGLSTTFAIPIAAPMEAEETPQEDPEGTESSDSATDSTESPEEQTFEGSSWILPYPPLEDQRPIDPQNHTQVMVALSRDISYTMNAIRAIWTHMQYHYLPPQTFGSPEVHFYSRFALSLCCLGELAARGGLYWLRLKARAHENYLSCVNEVIAMQPNVDEAYIRLRVWNTNERANLIAAIDILQDTVDQYFEPQPTTLPADDMVQTIPGNNHSIDIIDPETGLPVVITNGVNHNNGGGPGTDTSIVLTNGVNHNNVGGPETGQPIVNGVNHNNGGGPGTDTSIVLTNGVNHNNVGGPGTGQPIVLTNGVNHNHVGGPGPGTDPSIVITNGVNHNNAGGPANDPQTDTQFLNMTYDGASDFIPTSARRNSRRPDAGASRSTQNIHDAASTAKEDDDDAITWVHQEVWTGPPHSPDRTRVGDSVPRGFGGSPHRYRLALRSYSELDQGHSGLESLSTSGVAGSQRSDLSTANSINENRPAQQGETNTIHESVVNDTPEGTTIHREDDSSSPRLSFDATQPLVPQLFDMFSVTVEDSREMSSVDTFSRERSEANASVGGSSAGVSQRDNDQRPEFRGVAIGMRTSSRNMSPASGSNMSRSLLSNQNLALSWNDSVGGTSHRRNAGAYPGPSHYRKSETPAGNSSTSSSQMISTNLTARRRRRNLARSRIRAMISPSRLVYDLEDDVPVSAAFGFEEPDNAANEDRDSRVRAWLRVTGESQTAPAVVNTSRINVHAQRN